MKSSGLLKAAVKEGIVSTTTMAHNDIYEYFLEVFPEYQDKATAITIVSEDKRVSERLVYKILKDFGC